MIRRISSLIAVMLLASPVLAQTEPRPGSVAGLDLSSPQSAAESFIRAWNDEDYFVVWLALDPQMRSRFQSKLQIFDFRSIFGDVDIANTWDQFIGIVSESQSPEQSPGILADSFADFGGMMRVAGSLNSLPLAFAPTADRELEADAPNGSIARVHIAPAGGGGTLVLRSSTGGLWRFLGIEGREAPQYWLYAEQSNEQAQ